MNYTKSTFYTKTEFGFKNTIRLGFQHFTKLRFLHFYTKSSRKNAIVESEEIPRNILFL